MSIVDTFTAIASTLKAEVPDLADTYVHQGLLTAEDLKRYTRKSPSAIVALGRTGGVELHGGSIVVVPLRWTVFLVTSDAPQKPRTTQTLVYLQQILKVIGKTASHRWGVAGNHKPSRLSARNLYNGTLDKRGLSLWAVEWEQPLDLPDDLGNLDAFETLVADWDLDRDGVDDDDAQDIVELEQP